jgi:hypothetical protein
VIDGNTESVKLLDDASPSEDVLVEDDANKVVRYDGKLPMDDIDSGPEFNQGLSPQSFNVELSRRNRT